MRNSQLIDKGQLTKSPVTTGQKLVTIQELMEFCLVLLLGSKVTTVNGARELTLTRSRVAQRATNIEGTDTFLVSDLLDIWIVQSAMN